MTWIVQLRSEAEGARYYTARGKGVCCTKSKAKVFIKEREARAVAEACTLWPNAKACEA